jgi:hypothetical protein
MDINDMELVKIEQINARELFTAAEKRKPFLANIEKQVMSIVPDITTSQGRKDIASIAYKVAQTKTKLDKLRAAEVRALKDLPKQIDAGGKEVRDFLQGLQDKYRKPLTDWEEAERLKAEAEETAREIAKAHEEALAENDLIDREKKVAEQEAAIAKAKEEERLKAEAAKVEAERIAREKEIAEAAKKEIEEATRRAEEAAKKAEEEKAEAARRAELEKIEAAKQAEIDRKVAVQRAKDEAEAKRKEQERLANEKAEKEEAERKAADKEHRANIKEEACIFIEGAFGLPRDQVEDIFDSISNEEVPHIIVKY